MKKLTAILIATLLLAAMFAFPTSAAGNYNIPCDIVISSCFSNPNTVPYEGPASTKDMCEYMEIVNISNHDVDLYNYTFYYVNKGTPDAVIEAASQGVFSKSNVFASAPGENVLKPGETALIWFIGNDNYTYIDSCRLHTINADGTATHDMEKYWNLICDFSRDMCWQNPPEKINGLLLAWDISDTYGLGSSEHFNLANPSATKAIGYFVCARDTTVDTYLTGVVIPNTALSADVEYCFDLNDSKVLSCTSDILYDITPGYLHPSQTNLADLLGVTFETTAEETTTAAPETTTAAPDTTPEPVETTEAPVETTEAPTADTTVSPTTNAPEPGDTEPATAGGCGGAIIAPALMLFCIPAVMLIKKKHE
jgi:hypothetical protein